MDRSHRPLSLHSSCSGIKSGSRTATDTILIFQSASFTVNFTPRKVIEDIQVFPLPRIGTIRSSPKIKYKSKILYTKTLWFPCLHRCKTADKCKISLFFLLRWTDFPEILLIYHNRRSFQRAFPLPLYGTEQLLHSRFLKRAIVYFGYQPQILLTDNGSEFT